MKLYIVEKSQEKMPILFLYLPIASKTQFYILLAVKTLNYTYEWNRTRIARFMLNDYLENTISKSTCRKDLTLHLSDIKRDR